MWCNKYKNLRFDDERLKTLYRSLYIILNWTVVTPLRLHIKPSLKSFLKLENEEVSLEDTEDIFLCFLFFFFLDEAGLAVFPTCVPKKNVKENKQ